MMNIETLISSFDKNNITPILNLEEAKMVYESDEEIAFFVEFCLTILTTNHRFAKYVDEICGLGADPEKLAEITFRSVVTHCLNNIDLD